MLHTAAGATEYASVTASLKVTVDDDDAENSLPTGVPTISPTAVPEVGVTLTADPSGISDPDGPANPTFSYQWVRVSAANVETDISGATSATYEVQAADVGSTLKVKASFTDGRNKVETVESAPTAVVTVTQVTVNFGAAAYTAAEGGAAAAVQVTLDKAPNRILNIAIAATPGGGADTGDYSVSPTQGSLRREGHRQGDHRNGDERRYRRRQRNGDPDPRNAAAGRRERRRHGQRSGHHHRR